MSSHFYKTATTRSGSGLIKALSMSIWTTRNNKDRNQKSAHQNASALRAGFTLIEMIVAIFIFSIAMVIATGALVSILGANRKAQAVKSVMNNVNFSIDSMTRSIRTGTKYECNVPNCDVNGTDEFTFKNADGEEVTYRLSNNRIVRSVETGPFLPLTAPEVTITLLKFYAGGEDGNDTYQPRVLIIVKGEAGTNKALTTFNLETLVSQRIFDR